MSMQSSPDQSSRQQVDLLRFTFESLYFCGTPVQNLRGDQFRTAVNDWYMPLIRSGWAVPLAFIIDVSTLLHRPSTNFQNRWKENIREDIRQLSLNYYKMLRSLRRQPIFAEVVDLLAQTSNQARRDEATKTFLRFLLVELSHFRRTYSFNTRDLKLIHARPSADGLRDMQLILQGKQRKGSMQFGDPTRMDDNNEFGTIVELLTEITDYYTAHPLREFISDEERLMVTVAAKRDTGMRRIDYQFLCELLQRAELAEMEVPDPKPQMVEQIIPTDSYEVDGNVGGYIDVNRRKFSGSLAEVLPMDLALCRYPELMYNKLLNEGALHFVRENIECVEEELRLLFCLVVDSDDRMMATPEDLHPGFSKAMTPYIRARVLAALLTMDLARFVPREKVHADFALFLWNGRSKRTYHTEFDLFTAWTPQAAQDRFRFVAGFSQQAPFLFDNRLSLEAERQNMAMDRDPGQYIVSRSHTRLYHCRHLIVFTSEATRGDMVPHTDPRLLTSGPAGDSLLVAYCDVNRATIGVARPQILQDIVHNRHAGSFGELSEDQLRSRIVAAVLQKAAGKVARTDTFDALSEVL